MKAETLGALDFGGTPIVGPKELAKATAAVLQGNLCAVPRFRGDDMVRRVVSVGAGIGAWGAYAALRFPYAWLDMYETDAHAARFCKLNAPPGARVFLDPELRELEARACDRCDVLHLTIPTSLHHFDLGRLRVVTVEWRAEELALLQGGKLVKAGLRLVAGAVLDVGHHWQTWVKP